MKIKRWLLPIQRCLEARVHMRSGLVIVITCSNIKTREINEKIVEMSVKDQVGWPMFMSLPEITCIQTRRIWRRRP